MHETEFEKRADEELNALLEAIIACSDEVDPDLESGVLTINFDDDSKFVVNSHRAAQQIWMAADRAAWHFNDGRWLDSKRDDELWATLSGVLSRKLDQPVALSK